MRFDSYLPSERLRPYIKRFVISETGDERTYKVLPGTSLVMGFQYRGRLSYFQGTGAVQLAMSGVTGLQNTYRIFKNSPAIGSVLAVFTEIGAASFFNVPIHELFEHSVALDNFMNRSALTALEEQLSEAPNDQQRIQLIERFLLSQLRPVGTDKLVAQAVQLIEQSRGTIRISALLDILCISQSPLEKRFRKVVGTSPKKFSSIVRMQNALQLLSTNQEIIETSFAAGYFDQAHFGNEFRAFTGVTPTDFLQASTPC